MGWDGKCLQLMLDLPWKPMNHVVNSSAEGAYLIHWRNKKSPNHNHEDALATV